MHVVALRLCHLGRWRVCVARFHLEVPPCRQTGFLIHSLPVAVRLWTELVRGGYRLELGGRRLIDSSFIREVVASCLRVRLGHADGCTSGATDRRGFASIGRRLIQVSRIFLALLHRLMCSCQVLHRVYLGRWGLPLVLLRIL